MLLSVSIARTPSLMSSCESAIRREVVAGMADGGEGGRREFTSISPPVQPRATSRSFSARRSFLIAASRFRAADLDGLISV
jgi:hypothetical protein